MVAQLPVSIPVGVLFPGFLLPLTLRHSVALPPSLSIFLAACYFPSPPHPHPVRAMGLSGVPFEDCYSSNEILLRSS